VGVEKHGAAASQAIHVRRLDLRMASQASHPVIHVIQGDEQHVGAVRRGGGSDRPQGNQYRDKGRGSHHDLSSGNRSTY